MIFYLLLCNILFIPITFCSNTTQSTSNITSKIIVSTSHQENLSNGTKGPLLSEGGSILPETLISALPEGSHTKINSNEIRKNKVHPRKGVVYPGNSTISKESILNSNENHNTLSSTPGIFITSNDHVNYTTLEDNSVTIKSKNFTLPKLSKDKETTNKTQTIKKPLILNADILENQTVKSSSETMVNIEHQLPNKNVKSYVTTKHPGMVMPIVITILLVPMFAVLGYMALRRGQEAWKNRHYKRMDFLLDGMYND